MNMLQMTPEQYEAHQARVKGARLVKGKANVCEQKPLGRPPRKYKNVPTVKDEIRFDSKRESERYAELLLLEKAGEISKLELQPKFRCVVNDQLVCSYRADFVYMRAGKRVVEDVKGYRTPLYRLKKKLVLALLGIEIVEIT